MQITKQCSAVSARQPCAGLRVAAVQPRQSVLAAAGKTDDVYLGFPKGDYAPREGRKGRVIKDDPSKYPDKEDLGFFKGVVGGWAGGEAALKASIEKAKAPEIQVKPYPAPKPKPGAEPIYVGFGKEPEEFKLRNSGAQGRVIYDSAEKYPAKEDVGFLAGVTGGFAGGERGVKAFVRDGEVRMRKAGTPGGQPMSPLGTAFVVLSAGLVGAAVLAQVSPQGLSGEDEFKVNMLTGFVSLLVVGGGILAFRSLGSAEAESK